MNDPGQSAASEPPGDAPAAEAAGGGAASGRRRWRALPPTGPPSLFLRLVIWCAWASLAVAGVIVLASIGFAWRVSNGPVAVTPAVRELLMLAGPPGLSVERARLAWTREAGPGPLALELDGVALRDRLGVVRDRVRRLTLGFSPGRLLAFEVEPDRIEAQDGRVSLARLADGSIGLAGDLDQPARPRAAGAAPRPARLPAISANRIELGLAGVLPGATIVCGCDLSASPDASGRLGSARLHAELVAGSARPVVDASLRPAPGGRTLFVTVAPFDPSGLPFEPGARLFDGRLGLHATIALGRRFEITSGRAEIGIGPGILHAGPQPITVGQGRVVVRMLPKPGATLAHPIGRAVLEAADLAIATGAVRSTEPSAVELHATGAIVGDPSPGGSLDGTLELSAGPVGFGSLPHLWPPAVAVDARRWVVGNLPAGMIASSEARIAVASRDGIAGIAAAAATATLVCRNATLRWLAPIEPATGVDATIDLPDTSHLLIAASRGTAHGLDIAGTTMRISGLTSSVQDGRIEAHLSGRVGDLVWVLGQRRLHLRIPAGLSLAGATGHVAGTLLVTLPLSDRVRMSEIGLHARASFSKLHLAGIALGRPLDDGELGLDATEDGLALTGQGRFAGLPIGLDLGVDFRAGAPDAAFETATVTAPVDQAALAGAVPRSLLRMDGTAPTVLAYRLDHAGRASVTIDANLRPAGFRTGFGWSKQPDTPGHARVEIGLARGRLVRLGPFGVVAPGLELEAAASIDDRRISEVVFSRARIGRTDAAGRIEIGPRGAIRASLHGDRLDLRPLLSGTSQRRPIDPPRRSPVTPARPSPLPWEVSAAFRRVDLVHGLTLGGVSASVGGGGGRFMHGEVSAEAPSPLHVTLRSAADARTLSAEVTDAGGLLEGLGLTSRIGGGRLRLIATEPDAAGPLALTGKAELLAFTVRNTPVAARLLRDATIYGLADPATGADLSVTRLELPFAVSGDELELRDAHAWQPALGLTATGSIGLVDRAIAITGTLVPAYALNTLPGRLPLIGRLFSPERGGGLFAARYRIGGTLDDPTVRFDPLAALAPGVLRNVLPP